MGALANGMTAPVTLPLWFVLILLAVLAWVILERLLVPSVRWFFRSRANRIIDELNRRLGIELPHFALTKRQVLVDRLMYDPMVTEAVAEHCRETGEPRDVAMLKVETYAREIVPSFNAYVYFRFGTWICKRLAATLYRMRLGHADADGLAHIANRSSVVFVMNHRSNMDYVLVAYLALYKAALSYAVGEWARIWPLQQLISAMGAYFVRRGSGNPLYRRVLERYVGMSVEGGVTQAIYPEGGLSKDGLLQAPRLGLLDYMVKCFDPSGERDLVFIPVGINYDRTLEDRSLLRSLDADQPPVGRMRVIGNTLAFAARNGWRMMRGRWSRFGHACANFGSPISMREWLQERNVDLRHLSREARFEQVAQLADHLMAEVGKVIPVLPVSLIATALLQHPERPLTLPELRTAIDMLIDRLAESGAPLYIPGRNWDYAIELGLNTLTLRGVLRVDDGRYVIADGEAQLLRYYANSIAHFLEK
jgi:glycerol-3-phosphate O-acyltransferase